MDTRQVLLGIGGMLILVTLVGGFYYIERGTFFGQGAALATANSHVPRPVPAHCGEPEGSTCVEYRNEQDHFSVFHSNLDSVKTYNEGGGASTIVFENTDLASGLQIFVVPYGESSVSHVRFLEDDPSGVRDDEHAITADGAKGEAFYSKNQLLGDTYEVWFIHGNYLYEVTTLKPLEQSLVQFMQTWQFI